MERTVTIDERTRRCAEQFNDVLIELDIAKAEIARLTDLKKRLEGKLLLALKAMGSKGVKLDGIGNVCVRVDTRYSVADRAAFRAWYEAKGIEWEIFYAISPQKIGAFCKAQEEIEGAEFPKGVETYEQESIRIVGRAKGASAG